MSLTDLHRRATATDKCGRPEAKCQHKDCLKLDYPWWYCGHDERWLPGNLVSYLADNADIKFKP